MYSSKTMYDILIVFLEMLDFRHSFITDNFNTKLSRSFDTSLIDY